MDQNNATACALPAATFDVDMTHAADKGRFAARGGCRVF
jgi:hypothetical protein